MCLFQKKGSRRTKLGAICVKTKTKTQKQKTRIQKFSYKTAGQKLKIKKIHRDQVREKMRKGKKKEKGCILDMKIFNP